MHYLRRFNMAFTLGTLALFGAGQGAALGGWQEHTIRQGDGKGGWIEQKAFRQALKHPDADFTMPFGMVQMGNGEIAMLCSREKQPPRGARTFEPIIAFSNDGGATWTDFSTIPGTTGRPQYLQWLGGRRLSFITEVFDKAGKPQRIFSGDYGRTWDESIEHPPTKQGMPFNVEGNGWIDRDENGAAKAILELGWHYAPGKTHPKDDATVVFRRSRDGGRTWTDEVAPPQWKFTVEHNGKSWLRGVSEGAIVRATNGDLVAALRTDMPPRYFDEPHDDSLEGTAISISSDDGKTWSGMNFLFDAGRHHANLQRLPNGDLVCTLIVRDDIQDGKLASHRRGCDALVSRDHGKTWNRQHRYELDRFGYLREDGYWVDGQCGHIAAVALDDGHVISAYGHYQLGAAVLIKWQPDSATNALPPGTKTEKAVPKGHLKLPDNAQAVQGVALTKDSYFSSGNSANDGSGLIHRYDTNWKHLETKRIQVAGVDHIGALSHHEGFLWAGWLSTKEPRRSIVTQIRADSLTIERQFDITSDVTWIDPVCYDGRFVWVGDLSDLGLHRYRIEQDRLVREAVFRYPKEMHFSQGLQVRGEQLYSIHTFGTMDGLFEFEISKLTPVAVNLPRRVWPVAESNMHLEGFDFIPDRDNEIWHAQGSQVDRWRLSGLSRNE